jgi:hypothetical protein
MDTLQSKRAQGSAFVFDNHYLDGKKFYQNHFQSLPSFYLIKFDRTVMDLLIDNPEKLSVAKAPRTSPITRRKLRLWASGGKPWKIKKLKP